MAIAEPTASTERRTRLLTAADVAALPSQLPSGAVDYELWGGRLAVMMSPAADDHAAIQAMIAHHLVAQGQLPGHGRARTEGGVLLARNPDTVLGTDAAFIATRSLPLRHSAEGYLETVPNLVVEIRSKNDSAPELEEKTQRYLSAGVEMVWIVDPSRRTVVAHRREGQFVEFGPDSVLTAQGIIPGFRLPVAELFAQ